MNGAVRARGIATSSTASGTTPVAVVSAVILLVLVLGALFCRWVAPYDPYDLASLNLMDSFQPPAFMADGTAAHVLGTDDQGRDMLSAILYGARLSFIVGFSVGGVRGGGRASWSGCSAGYAGGSVDAGLMRLADVQLSFPAILIALLIDGVVSVSLPIAMRESVQVYVLIFAIGISLWPQFARTVRGSTLVERGKEYVMAAQVIGLSSPRIMLSHILPNVLGPVMVIATLNFGLAIIQEATLSYLGVGLPPTQPSVGTLIRVGNDFLYSGEWWIALFPGITLLLIVLSINLFGDWLRDALNPRLR